MSSKRKTRSWPQAVAREMSTTKFKKGRLMGRPCKNRPLKLRITTPGSGSLPIISCSGYCSLGIPLGLAKTAAAPKLGAGRLHSVKRPERLRYSAPQTRFAGAGGGGPELEGCRGARSPSHCPRGDSEEKHQLSFGGNNGAGWHVTSWGVVARRVRAGRLSPT